MKKTIQSLLLAVILLGFLGCAKKSDDPELKYYLGLSYRNYLSQTTGNTIAPYSIFVYNSEADFLAGATPVFQTTSASLDVTSSIQIPLTGQTAYYVHVINSNGLTNRRENIRNPFVWVSFGGGVKFSYQPKFYSNAPYLMTNPVKLKVSVNAGGTPVSGAAITLYESLADYQSNTPLYSKPYYLSNSNILDYYTNTWKIDPKTIFYGTTDASGNYTFTELEPKQYWVKVTSGNLNNSTGVINTTSALPDDIKTTTTLNIQIQ